MNAEQAAKATIPRDYHDPTCAGRLHDEFPYNESCRGCDLVAHVAAKIAEAQHEARADAESTLRIRDGEAHAAIILTFNECLEDCAQFIEQNKGDDSEMKQLAAEFRARKQKA
jgi:hypothetical protein